MIATIAAGTATTAKGAFDLATIHSNGGAFDEEDDDEFIDYSYSGGGSDGDDEVESNYGDDDDDDITRGRMDEHDGSD